MYQYTPCAFVRVHRENRTLLQISIGKSVLQCVQVLPDTKTAKFRDYHPNQRRQNRYNAGGFFSPVKCATTVQPGVRGIQHGENRNKRVVTFGTMIVPGNFCPISKSKEYETMNAQTAMGAPAHTPMQALSRLLPTGAASHLRPHNLPIIRRKHCKTTATKLTYKATQTGFIGYLNGVPVAWVVQGYHCGQTDKQPAHCRFVDVAYHRQTLRGVNLETADFAKLQQAFDFLEEVFSTGGAL